VTHWLRWRFGEEKSVKVVSAKTSENVATKIRRFLDEELNQFVLFE
jgi:hypothetical protein